MKSLKLKIVILGTACSMLALPIISFAEGGPYIGIEGGANWQEPQSLMQAGFHFVTLDLKDPVDSGYIVGIKGGWALPSHLRPELELDYRSNDFKSFNARLYDGGGSLDAKGSESAISGFVNLWYDFKALPGAFSAMHPYIGGGVGVTRIIVRNMEAGGVQFGSASYTVASYQLGAGVNFNLRQNLTMSVDYRYLSTQIGNLGNIQNIPPGDVYARYRANSVLIGLINYF